MCQSFLDSDKKVNPITGRNIKKDGPIYNKFIGKCKTAIPEMKPLLQREREPIPEMKPLLQREPISFQRQNPISFQRPVREPLPQESKKLDYLNLEVSKFPTVKFPAWTKAPNKMVVKPGTVIEPKAFVEISGKKYKIGDRAKFDNIGSEATITNIGLKQITLRKNLTSKDNRLSINNFVAFNS
jgi:hypothetical protein